MARPRQLVPIAGLLSALILASCYPPESPSDIIRDAAAIVTLASVEPITASAETGGGVFIPPESEIPDSRFLCTFDNPRNIPFYFEILDRGAPQNFARLEILNTREGILHIEGVREYEEYDLTLNLERADRRWNFGTPPHELPRITGMSFEVGLLSVIADQGGGGGGYPCGGMLRAGPGSSRWII